MSQNSPPCLPLACQMRIPCGRGSSLGGVQGSHLSMPSPTQEGQQLWESVKDDSGGAFGSGPNSGARVCCLQIRVFRSGPGLGSCFSPPWVGQRTPTFVAEDLRKCHGEIPSRCATPTEAHSIPSHPRRPCQGLPVRYVTVLNRSAVIFFPIGRRSRAARLLPRCRHCAAHAPLMCSGPICPGFAKFGGVRPRWAQL